MNEDKKRIEELELALRIICTWASCDCMDRRSRPEAMKQIEDKCREVLKRKDAT